MTGLVPVVSGPKFVCPNVQQIAATSAPVTIGVHAIGGMPLFRLVGAHEHVLVKLGNVGTTLSTAFA
jgi:hypothetical protein